MLMVSKKNNRLRHYLRNKVYVDHGYNDDGKLEYDALPEVVQVFDIRKMLMMRNDHEKKSNLYRNHDRYINYLGDSAGYLPLTRLSGDIFDKLEDLRLRFPNFSSAIDFYREQFALSRLSDCAAFAANPLLLAGPAGVGKTAFCHELSRIVDTHFSLIAMSTATAGFIISGNSSMWTDGKPGKVVESLARGGKANPLIVADEIDKVGGDHRYDPLGSLYQLLESETAVAFIDEALEVATDCSHIVWVGTANRLERIPAPILSRFTVIDVAAPTAGQMRHVLGSIYKRVRENHHWGSRFSDELPDAVIDRIINSGLEPRQVQKELISACGRAVLRQAGCGRYELRPDDLNQRGTAKKSASIVMSPVFDIAPVHQEPEESLTLWSVREVRYNNRKSHHLVGYLPRQAYGMVTSAIQEFDRENRLVRTRSGGMYHLNGQPGSNSDAEYVWRVWKETNNATEEIDVTSQYYWVH